MGTNLGHSVIQGNTLRDNLPPKSVINPSYDDLKDTVVKLPGTYMEGNQKKSAKIHFTKEILSKHGLLIGGTGSGKTNAMNFFVEDIRDSLTSEDVLIIFDTKGDFFKKFYKPGDLVISSSPTYKNICVNWNVYREILIDGFDSDHIRNNTSEITKAFFKEAKEKTTQQFFPNAAQDLLSSIILAQIRLGNGDISFMDEFFNNKALRRYLDTLSYKSVHDILKLEGFEDLASSMIYIGNGEGEQALGVFSEIQSNMRQLLIGAFAAEGNFSMRNFVRSKGGKVLFIEYDLAIGETLTPIYKLLFDLALKEAMSAENAKGNVYMVCDEFKLLPNLYHIEDGVNFGRSLGVKILASIQSIEQLYEIYGEFKGRNIAAGFSSVLTFKVNDTATREFVSNLYGKNIIVDQYQSAYTKNAEHKREGKTVEDWDLLDLDKGEAIIGLPFEKPFKFKVEEYKRK